MVGWFVIRQRSGYSEYQLTGIMMANCSQDKPIVSYLASFFLAMALFPEVQLKAQAELDTVVGINELPRFKNRENLPYINALVKEVLRWHPVVPMNVAHASDQDEFCEGYFITESNFLCDNQCF